MRKVYLDTTQANIGIAFLTNHDAEVVLAGTPIYAMPVQHKNSEYQRFAEEYDIRFIFEDAIPEVNFYTVPMVEVFAVDGVGGYIGSVGQPTDLQDDAIAICYIDADRNCYLIAENGGRFLGKAHQWQKMLVPCAGVEVFASFEEARKKYEFLDDANREGNTLDKDKCT